MKHSAFECTKNSEHLSAFSTECSHTLKALGTQCWCDSGHSVQRTSIVCGMRQQWQRGQRWRGQRREQHGLCGTARWRAVHSLLQLVPQNRYQREGSLYPPESLPRVLLGASIRESPRRRISAQWPAARRRAAAAAKRADVRTAAQTRPHRPYRGSQCDN